MPDSPKNDQGHTPASGLRFAISATQLSLLKAGGAILWHRQKACCKSPRSTLRHFAPIAASLLYPGTGRVVPYPAVLAKELLGDCPIDLSEARFSGRAS